jgi:hypothetical protein
LWPYIAPGKPTENACVESFIGRFRDECLNEKVDTSIYRIWAKVGVWGHRDGRPTVLKVAGGARGRGAELVR